MRKVVKDINIKTIKNYADRSLQLELIVNGEITKCSRTYAWDRQNGWFYTEHSERVYVSENYVAMDLYNFCERTVKILDMISDNLEEISGN